MQENKKIGLDKDTFWNLLFIAFIGALAGSKLLYIILLFPGRSWEQP